MIKSMFNDEINNKLKSDIDGYLNDHGSEFMSDFYSEICDTNVETEENKVIIYDSRSCNICEIEYYHINEMKNQIYSLVIHYLIKKYNDNILKHLKEIGKIN